MNKKLLHIFLLILLPIWTESVILSQHSIVVNGVTLFEHGYNAASEPVTSPFEVRDSVTIGSTTEYYLNPSSLNTLYTLVAGVPGGSLTSSFSWVLNGAGTGDGVISSIAGFDNNVQVVWNTLGTRNLSATETSTLSCASTPVVTPIAVIAAPTLTSVDIANVTCQTTPFSITSLPDASLTLNSVVNGNQNVTVSYTITGPSAYSYSNSANIGNSSTLTLPVVAAITVPGAYTITINTITDRISAKCGITVNLVGISKIFYVTPLPRALPTKHIKNDGW